MKVKLLYTTGNNDILETTWDKPEPEKDEIEVKALMTGIVDHSPYSSISC